MCRYRITFKKKVITGIVLTLMVSQSANTAGLATVYQQNQYHYDGQGQNIRMQLKASDGIVGSSDWQKDLFGNTAEKTLTLSSTSNQFNGLLTRGQIYHGEQSIYNADNQLVKKINQQGQVQTYDYNANGQLNKITDFAGNEFSYQYNANGQMTQEVGQSQDGGQHYIRDLTYDGQTGQLIKVHQHWLTPQREASVTEYTYTPDGNMAQVKQHTGGQVYQINYRYDRYHRLTSQSDGLGYTTLYTYDALNRIQHICLGDNGYCMNQIITYHYIKTPSDPNLGQISQINYPNGLIKQMHYDGFNRLATLTMIDGKKDQQLRNIGYYYDQLGNLIGQSIRSETDASFDANYDQHYQYNALNHLIHSWITRPDDDSSIYQDTQAAFDERGNLIRQTVVPGPNQATIERDYQYNLLNQLTHITIHQGGNVIQDIELSDNWTKNGNLSADGLGNHFAYNFLGQLTHYDNVQDPNHVIHATYTYNAQGLRASKQINVDGHCQMPIHYDYDNAANANIINETQGAHQTHYLMNGDEHVVRFYDATPSYLVKGTKDIIAQVDNNNQVTESYNYQPYGAALHLDQLLQFDQFNILQPKVTEKTDYSIQANPFQYSAEYTDAESSMQYLRARYYAPWLHSFPQRDNTDLLNRYAYGNGNPIMNVDPSGHFAIASILLITSIITGIGSAIAGSFSKKSGDGAQIAAYILGGISLVSGLGAGGISAYTGVGTAVEANAGVDLSTLKPFSGYSFGVTNGSMALLSGGARYLQDPDHFNIGTTAGSLGLGFVGSALGAYGMVNTRYAMLLGSLDNMLEGASIPMMEGSSNKGALFDTFSGMVSGSLSGAIGGPFIQKWEASAGQSMIRASGIMAARGLTMETTRNMIYDGMHGTLSQDFATAKGGTKLATNLLVGGVAAATQGALMDWSVTTGIINGQQEKGRWFFNGSGATFQYGIPIVESELHQGIDALFS